MEVNKELSNSEDSRSEEDNNKKNNNIDLHNIQSFLNLKKYELSCFHYIETLNKNNVFPEIFDHIYMMIETIQILCIFYNIDYFPNLPDSIYYPSSVFIFKNLMKQFTSLFMAETGVMIIYFFIILHITLGYIARKFPEVLLKVNVFIIILMQRIFFIPVLFSMLEFLNCSKKEDTDDDTRYICFNSYHTKIIISSLIGLFFYLSFSYVVTYFTQTYIPLSKDRNALYSNKTIITYRRVILIEVLNLMLFQVYFNNKYISSIIMFAGFAYLLFIHYNYQIYYSKKMNCFYSAVWFSMAFSTFIYIFFVLTGADLLYPIFIGLSVVGFIIGWFLNNFFFNRYTNKIFTRIENKYNQQHIISKLKEQLEMEHVNDEETQSIETIVTQKKIIKKDKVYNKPYDCAYVSKFIMNNRSINSFYLVNSLFKEGISQFERSPEIYIQYWYFLHGIRKFVSINKKCFLSTDANELLDKMDRLSEKVLFKCASLSKSFFSRFLIYNAIYIYELDRSHLISTNDNSGDNNALDFELMEIRNRSIQYHIAALNSLKNLMNSLRTLDSPSDIENAMIINDNLTDILNKGESHYKKFVIDFNYSKESLELYILFLRNSMNRGDLAEQYIQMLEENEDTKDEEEVEKTNKYASGYERSEMMSSSNSDMESRKSKILKKNMLHRCQEPLYKLLSVVQISTTIAIVIGILGNIIYIISFENVISNISFFSVAAESPVIVSQIKSAVRLLSLMGACGINPTVFPFTETIRMNLKYLEEVYFPLIYTFHSTNSEGFYTINPIYYGVVDEVKDQSFYNAMMKIYRKAQLVVDGLNRTSILTPEFLHDKDVSYFGSNSKGQFGQLFLNSLEITDENIRGTVNRHEMMFYIIMGIVVLFIIFIIFRVIGPYANKSYNFVKEIISIYKTLPSKYFNDQSNDYMDQIQEMCDNYDVEDEGLFKKESKRKNNSSKKLKYIFIVYCLLVTLFLLIPFMTVFLYKPTCQNLISFLVNSTKRAYYIAAVNLYDMEIYLKDRFYFNEGEELALLTETYDKLFKLENDLKNGKYGGKSSSQYDIFESLNHNPGCVRGSVVISKCEDRIFSDLYTKELSESPIDYLMVEYLNKLNEFISNAPTCKYNLTDPSELLLANFEIRDSVYVSILIALSYDITGHIDQMNELGTQYLLSEAEKYIKYTLVLHGTGTFLIFITFFIFVSKPIKRQLRIMDSLTNITFSIPSSVYNSSPKVKNFLENGKLE